MEATHKVKVTAQRHMGPGVVRYKQNLEDFLIAPGLSPGNRRELLQFFNKTDLGMLITGVLRKECDDTRTMSFVEPTATLQLLVESDPVADVMSRLDTLESESESDDSNNDNDE